MHATDHARNQTSGMTLDQYVRHCAGLGLVVRVYRYRCAKCGEKSAKVQAVNRELSHDLALMAQIDAIHGGTNRPKCCGEYMTGPRTSTNDGGTPGYGPL